MVNYFVPCRHSNLFWQETRSLYLEILIGDVLSKASLRIILSVKEKKTAIRAGIVKHDKLIGPLQAWHMHCSTENSFNAHKLQQAL